MIPIELLIPLLLTPLLHLAYIALAAVVFRKAGFSFWWGLLAIIPVLPIVVLALIDWPVLQQDRIARAATPAATEEDGYALLDRGYQHLRRHEYDEATAIFNRLATQWPDTPLAQDARIALDTANQQRAQP
jgi:hypothetical protein